MKRLIGIDLGSKTLGLAISDLLRITAQGLTTITFETDNYQNGLELLVKELASYDVEKIILGLPINMDGTKGMRAELAEEFGAMLVEKGFDVVYIDERMTTRMNQAILKDANMSKKKRKNVVDKMAAQTILQSYMDTLI